MKKQEAVGLYVQIISKRNTLQDLDSKAYKSMEQRSGLSVSDGLRNALQKRFPLALYRPQSVLEKNLAAAAEDADQPQSEDAEVFINRKQCGP